MHDPDTVAFHIRYPWLWPTSPSLKNVRWRVRLGRGSVVLAGHWFRAPDFITVWHREPGGHDTGTVCKRWRRKQTPKGRPRQVTRLAWLLHVHHWHLQIHPWQTFRRWAFTRCEWCGGRSRKRDRVDVSHSWSEGRDPWWRGERGLVHGGCSAVESAHGLCLCDDPLFDYGTYGQCFGCGKRRSYGMKVDDGHRALAALPVGSRIPPDVQAFLDPIYVERRGRIEKEA